MGDEGGFSPILTTNSDSFSIIRQAINLTNIQPEYDVFFGLDAAASKFFSDKKYKISDNPELLTSVDLTSYYETLNKDFHLLYIEDPFAEEDWDAWSNFSLKLSRSTIIAGDDFEAAFNTFVITE